MQISKGWRVLVLLVSVWAVPNVYGASSAQMPRHIVFASDPQFPWTDNTDARLPESDSQRLERSRWLIETQYDSIADFRRYQGGSAAVPVMINGDMTAFGHAGERSYVQQTLDAKLQGVYDYGLGGYRS